MKLHENTININVLLFPHRYARLGLARVGLPPGLPLDSERVEAMLKQQGRVVVYFSLSLLLAPVVETLVLLDRMVYLQENGEPPHTGPETVITLQILKPLSVCRCGQSACSSLQPKHFSKKLCAGGAEGLMRRRNVFPIKHLSGFDVTSLNLCKNDPSLRGTLCLCILACFRDTKS